MTQAELEAIQETGLFGAREEIRDGQRVRIPVLFDDMVASYHGPDDPVSVVDAHGQRWMLGRALDGTPRKRRVW